MFSKFEKYWDLIQKECYYLTLESQIKVLKSFIEKELTNEKN